MQINLLKAEFNEQIAAIIRTPLTVTSPQPVSKTDVEDGIQDVAFPEPATDPFGYLYLFL